MRKKTIYTRLQKNNIKKYECIMVLNLWRVTTKSSHISSITNIKVQNHDYEKLTVPKTKTFEDGESRSEIAKLKSLLIALKIAWIGSRKVHEIPLVRWEKTRITMELKEWNTLKEKLHFDHPSLLSTKKNRDICIIKSSGKQ